MPIIDDISRAQETKLSAKIRHLTAPQPGGRREGLAKWRERILFAVLATALTLSLAAFVPAIAVGVRERLWGLVIIDSSVYLVTWLLFIFRGLRYEIRATIAVLLVYLVGLNVCIEVGLFSGGPAYLFTCAILAGLLLGLKAAILTVTLNVITIVSVGYLISGGHLPGEHVYFGSMERALAAGASYILLNAVSAVSAAVLVRGLSRITTRQTELTRELSREKTELIDTRRKLNAEIEERRRSEKALSQSEAQYRLLTESVNDVIFTLDLEMNYTYVSPSVERLQGWQPQEMLGANIATTLPPHSLELAAQTLLSQLALSEATGDFHRSVVLELELLRKDGSTVWSEVTAGFLLSDDGKPTAILGVSRDISERLKVQQEREALQEQLARSKKMEALGLLAGGVAHDLNNVLSGIVSYPDLLLLDMDESSPLYKPISSIRQSGQKAAAIVQDLLTLARRGVVSAEVLNLNTLIQEYLISPEHKTLMTFHQAVQVYTNLEADRPNIGGSEVHLKKTVMNLVSNAAEAQPKGGTISITTRIRYLDRPIKGYDRVAEGEYVIMSVSDQGEGIAAVDLPRIFEPFYTKKVMGRSGTGLGMAVVWGTVQDHRGYIDVQSIPGQGTTFSLYFPTTTMNVQAHNAPLPLESITGQGQTVLVVDDVSEQREMAVSLLTRLNYQASAVSSGEAAIAFLHNHDVDLLVLDMIMDPGMDGLDTYQAICVSRPGQKAIIASGFAETERVRKALDLGAGPYVKKPYTIEKVGLAIRQALAGKS
jgi:two-component system cell cycle sensor histidine kinase/response regulator CckA